MFCNNCGKEIDDKAVVCPNCGVATGTRGNTSVQTNGGNSIAIVGFVFSFLIAIVGLICSIIGFNKAKKGAPHKGLALAGIIISAISMVTAVIIYIILIAAVLAA